MSYSEPVSPETFEAIHNVDIDKLSNLPDHALRPILPCLVRMSLCAPLDTSEKWTLERKKILKCLSGIDVVNSLVALLSIDFHELEQDARKEQSIRNKMGGTQTQSPLISQLEQGLALDFERSDAARKLRLLLSELLFIMSQMKETRTEFYHKSSELLESEVYLEEVSDVLCIAQAELPSLLPVAEVAEAMLHVDNGPWLLCRVVANLPDSFHNVCTTLIANGERQDEETVGGQRRAEALRLLCVMCPSQALTIRALCVKHCRLPGLTVALTLPHCEIAGDQTELEKGGLSDVVGFVIGLLLGSDIDVRNWFSQFIRNGQKRKDLSSILHALRQELLEQLICILPDRTSVVTDSQVVQGCAFMRLYCALKCIAGLRFNDEEMPFLLRLITCHPEPTGAGVRFITLGLCMLLACPYLLGNPEQERIAIEWIQWLVKESGHFEKVSGVKASFGEMLLLIAIHFHSNQTTAIADLVSGTLGMKSAVKSSSLTRMKAIFTQEIFTESIVAAHAVKVSVTENLNLHISGYLPVHCIYQLLKSRAFSKHKVSIKDWIFKQLCASSTPIHALIPPLIEAYVNSIIIPSAKTDRMNEPITEEDILSVFKYSVLTQHLSNTDSKKQNRLNHSEDQSQTSNFTTQLLLLYYVLLYQDTLLNNIKTIVSSDRQVRKYSDQLLSQLPIKALIREAQKEQLQYAGLFSPLLKLLATHFPHLCVVEDWLDEDMSDLLVSCSAISIPTMPCTIPNIETAFRDLPDHPTELMIYLEQLSRRSAKELLPYTEVIIDKLPTLLDPRVPRKVLELVKQIWIKLNTLIPRKIRVLTVNSLQQLRTLRYKPFTENDITMDPLIILRIDPRVFRCPPLTEILLRILEAFLQASRCYLSEHLQSNPSTEKTVQAQNAALLEKEELKSALIATQESAVVQILLEYCLPDDQHKSTGSLLCDLREVQCLVCSRLHQMFIADPNLAKLVHFQGYPSQLLPVTVAGIPSMHICLDFIPELISQPHLDKQIFSIELVSYLSQQYSLPKSLEYAKLAINVMTTLLGVLSRETIPDFFLPTLPALERISKAFPPLCDDIISFLMQLGKICNSNLSTVSMDKTFVDIPQTLDKTQLDPQKPVERELSLLSRYTTLSGTVQATFTKLVRSTALLQHQVH